MATYGFFMDTNLPPLVKFWYRVRSFNWAGDSQYSNAESIAILPPEAPSFLSAKIGRSNRVDLAWLAGNNSSGHKVERALNAGGIPETWVELKGPTFSNWNGGGAADGMTRAYDADIVRENTYFYRVRGVNPAGNSEYSSVVSVDIASPPAPYSPSASAFADRAAISWDSNVGDYGHVDGFVC